MDIHKISNSPDFRAKMIIGDERVQKFIKSSFMANSKTTFATLDKFSEIYPDSIVSVNVDRIKGNDYLVAQNGITGMKEKVFIENADVIKLNSRTSFIDLIRHVINKKSFWNNMASKKDFNSNAISQKIEHDVFNLDK